MKYILADIYAPYDNVGPTVFLLVLTSSKLINYLFFQSNTGKI